jgi:hypothetical protein
MRGSRGGHRESRGSSPATSYEAEAAEIDSLFQTKLAGLRRRLKPSEIPVAVRALREEKQVALKALRDRHARKRPGIREAIRNRGHLPGG